MAGIFKMPTTLFSYYCSYDASHYNGVPHCEYIGYNYESPPLHKFDHPFYQINMQDGVISEAVYFNDTEETIVFGSNRAKEEMMGTAFFYVTDTTGVNFDEGSIFYTDEINGISSVTKTEKLAINIFPNPIQKQAQINIASHWAGKLMTTLYDIHGQIVRQESVFVPQSHHIFSFSFEKKNLKNGIYFYEIRDKKGNRKVEKIVIGKSY